ncbi:Phosphatidate phosphatase LPIN3 isoform X1 [Oopsacas minuta]|uniref:phosphatidate phosphatase n=1 Tax=Oopsacas minuta TaxID=111878 RepID=A0AAV7KK53_9METZ|nr:Phosphatidate phosphatase LPIN3 isoform X1 [Oopsacas minuta]
MTRYLIKAGKAVRDFYNDMNGANLTGAIDIIVVRQKDGSLVSSPIHAHFGKLGVLRSREKEVELCVNGEVMDHLNIRLNEWGTAMIVNSIEDRASTCNSPNDEFEYQSIKNFDEVDNIFVIESDTGEELFQFDDIYPEDTQIECRNLRTPSLRSFQSTVSSIGRTRSISEGAPIYESNDEHLLSENIWLWKHNSADHLEFTDCGNNLSAVDESTDPPNDGIIGKMKKLLSGSTSPTPIPLSSSPEQHNIPISLNNITAIAPNTPKSSHTPELPRTPDLTQTPELPNHIPPQSKPVDISSDLGSSPENSQTVSPNSSPPLRNPFGLFSNCESPVAMSLCGGLNLDKTIEPELFDKYLVSFEKFSSSTDILSDPNLVVRINGKYYNWRVAAPILMSRICFNEPLSTENIVKLNLEQKQSRIRSWFNWSKKSDQISIGSEPKTPKFIEDSSMLTNSIDETIPIDSQTEFLLPSKITNVLTSEQLACLPLKEGANEVSLSVITRYQGTCRVVCTLYLWNYYDKIVISDIDGTITKSDALGQILPILGKDWSQKGVTDLFSKIEANGYKFIYLSARAIGQSNPTRALLQKIKQRNISLPDGPLLLAPLSLFGAFHQEVIAKKPDVFKIRCLEEVKSIFPPGSNPFFAGYGNRQTDVTSYEAIGIPKSLIFIINSRGQLRHQQALSFQSSYTNLTEYVDYVYPYLKGPDVIDNTFSDYQYWKPKSEYGTEWCLEFLKGLTDS